LTRYRHAAVNRDKYTAVAHAALDFANPFAIESLDRVVAAMGLVPGGTFLDIGAGKAALCARLASRAVRCDAIERSPLMAAEARRRSGANGGTASVTVHEEDAADYVARTPDASYDGAACIGSTHALSGLPQTLAALHRVISPDGWALIGEGFWERPPPSEYLAATGIEAHEFTPLAGLSDAAMAAGLRTHLVLTASAREWDDYEWAHARGIETYAAAHRSDPDVPAMLARSRAWRDAYLRWGRGTLGFALVACRRAEPPAPDPDKA
jgi:SAM-dependent methyltransferase